MKVKTLHKMLKLAMKTNPEAEIVLKNINSDSEWPIFFYAIDCHVGPDALRIEFVKNKHDTYKHFLSNYEHNSSSLMVSLQNYAKEMAEIDILEFLIHNKCPCGGKHD